MGEPTGEGAALAFADRESGRQRYAMFKCSFRRINTSALGSCFPPTILPELHHLNVD
jgi:hypothetical protein